MYLETLVLYKWWVSFLPSSSPSLFLKEGRDREISLKYLKRSFRLTFTPPLLS